MSNMYARRLKRPMDIAVSGAAIVALSPLLLAIGVAVRATSAGPALFAQTRAGKDGRPFEVLKFRSMLSPGDSFNPDGTEMANSERVTSIGRLIRRASFDELPQLVNVLRGDMSLIGPRPALMYQVERYSLEHKQRLAVRPGITGLAQVSGRNSLDWEQKIAFDIAYCKNLTFLNDIRILVRTAKAVISRDGQEFTKHDALSIHGDESYLKHI